MLVGAKASVLGASDEEVVGEYACELFATATCRQPSLSTVFQFLLSFIV